MARKCVFCWRIFKDDESTKREEEVRIERLGKGTVPLSNITLILLRAGQSIQKNYNPISDRSKSLFVNQKLVSLTVSHIRRPDIRYSDSQMHRVGRVLSFSPVVGIGTPPTPHPQASVPPPLLVPGEGYTRWRERGRESPSSDEGTHTVVLFIYTYFVVRWHIDISPIVLWPKMEADHFDTPNIAGRMVSWTLNMRFPVYDMRVCVCVI